MEKQIKSWLSDPALEMLPNETSMRSLPSIPPEIHHSVTNLQSEPIDMTMDFALRLAGDGRNVVPHVSASRISEQEALRVGTTALGEYSINHIFVMSGDNDGRPGVYSSSLELLEFWRDRGILFDEIGIVGHPEGHPDIPNLVLDQSLQDKQEFAEQTGAEMYIVTQMCFDPETVKHWIQHIRGVGINLPVFVGVPGPINLDKLIAYSGTCGVGDSAQVLRSNPALLRSADSETPPVFNPYDFLSSLANETVDSKEVQGVYFFTFNQLRETQEWINKTRETA